MSNDCSYANHRRSLPKQRVREVDSQGSSDELEEGGNLSHFQDGLHVRHHRLPSKQFIREVESQVSSGELDSN